MTEVGYPDYGRSVQTISLPLVSVAQKISPQFTSPLVYIGDLGYIDVYFDTSGLSDYYLVLANFWEDAAKTILVGTMELTAPPNAVGGMQWKTLGRYFDAVVENNLNTDVNNFKAWYRGSNNLAGFQPTQRDNVPAFWQNVSIGAGASNTYTLNTIYPGPAVLAVHHGTDTSWHVQIEYYDWGAKAWRVFVYVDGANSGVGGVWNIILPAAPLRVILANDSTSSRTFWASITC